MNTPEPKPVKREWISPFLLKNRMTGKITNPGKWTIERANGIIDIRGEDGKVVDQPDDHGETDLEAIMLGVTMLTEAGTYFYVVNPEIVLPQE